VILCSHLPGEGHFTSERFDVRGIVCRDDFDYWAGLAAVWESAETIVNVEHDMEVTDEHVAELIDCPAAACSFAYHVHWASTSLRDDVIAAGNGARDADRHPDPGFLQGGEEWAEWSAIGLVKITPEARIGPLRREPWQRLELAVHDAVKRPWCLHWPPVNHHHW
jgi:hypothetical protein